MYVGSANSGMPHEILKNIKAKERKKPKRNELTDESYTYDAVGNRFSNGEVYNNLNQLVEKRAIKKQVKTERRDKKQTNKNKEEKYMEKAFTDEFINYKKK